MQASSCTKAMSSNCIDQEALLSVACVRKTISSCIYLEGELEFTKGWLCDSSQGLKETIYLYDIITVTNIAIKGFKLLDDKEPSCQRCQFKLVKN